MEKVPEKSSGFRTPEEEVQFLRGYIAEREASFGKHELLPTEREGVAREAIFEYKNIAPEKILHEEVQMHPAETDAVVLRLIPEAHDERISELYGMLLQRGIKNTLSVIEKLNDPHIDDDFHRFLVQFLQSGKIADLLEGTPLSRALQLHLFEITLPPPTEADGKSFKELISAMEQFYAAMQGVADGRDNKNQDYFTLEIAEQNSNSHVVFYAAVPLGKSDMFEKNVIATFPKARIKELPDDYNIFTEGGAHVGAEAQFSAEDVLPIRTYTAFDHDPLHSILQVFSKLKDVGEGAAIQFVIMPAGEKYIKDFTYTLGQVQKGEKLEKKSLLGGFDTGFLKAGKHLVTGKYEKPEEKKIDEATVKHITEKIQHTISAVNIRVAASAATPERAQQILREIETAFNQFTEPTANSIRFNEIAPRQTGDFFHNFSYRLFNDKAVLPLNLRELTSLYHFPWGISTAPQLLGSDAIDAPVPLEMGKSGTLLGLNRYRGAETPIYFDNEDRLRHFYVIGQTGTGKTNLLKNMIVQDIKAGNGVCFLDPHGSDIQDILAQIPRERIDDVIYFDPAYTSRPMGLNMLEYDPRFPEQKTFVVDEMLSIFRKLFGAVPESMGPAFEQYFRNACLLILEDPESGATILEIGRVMADKAFRDMKLSKTKNPIIHQFWTSAEKTTGEAGLANYVPYITNKFDVFITNEIMRPIISQEKSAFNFREIMDNRKILLVNMSKGRLGEINANLIGLVIVGKILMAALSRVDSLGTALPPFYLYIDEFQNVTTNSISQILSEARKYKLGLTIAHQFIAQLDEGIKNAVFGNVGSISVFRVGVDDAEFLAKQFDPVFTAQDLIKIENRHAYMKMLVKGMPVKPFSMETLPPERGVPDIVDKIKEISYLRFGRDRAEVEEEMMKRYRTEPKTP